MTARRLHMKILVAYYSETGNTAKVAQTIGESLVTRGHEADLVALADTVPPGEIAPEMLDAYDLVILGSACHDADLAKPAKRFLERIPDAPRFKLAGFVTHASYTPEEGDTEQKAYQVWASRCALSFRQAGQEKEFDFLGCYGCQGAPSPPIEQFIHSNIISDEEGWQEYIEEVRKHPNERDLYRAREFAEQILARF
jgi:flavodoxin